MPICTCYDGWVFLGVQRPRTQTRSLRRPRTAGASRKGDYANPDIQDAGGSGAGGARLRHLPQRVLVREATAWAITDDNGLIGRSAPRV